MQSSGREAPRHRPDNSNGARHPAQPEQREDDPVEELLVRVAALGDFAEHYVAAKVDRVRVSIGAIVWRLAFIGALLLFAIVALLMATTHLFQGLAGGLAEWTGRPWLGRLLAGAFGLGAIAGSAVLVRFRMRVRRRARTMHQFEHRKAKQRARYGHDVDEVAQTAE